MGTRSSSALTGLLWSDSHPRGQRDDALRAPTGSQGDRPASPAPEDHLRYPAMGAQRPGNCPLPVRVALQLRTHVPGEGTGKHFVEHLLRDGDRQAPKHHPGSGHAHTSSASVIAGYLGGGSRVREASAGSPARTPIRPSAITPTRSAPPSKASGRPRPASEHTARGSDRLADPPGTGL
jgi:hypothetical protein